MSDLVALLETANLGGQPDTNTNTPGQVPPAGGAAPASDDAGGGQPDGGQPPDGGATDGAPADGSGAVTDLVPPDGTPAGDAGAQPGEGDAAGGEPSIEDLSPGLQKRIGALLEEIRDLKGQVSQLTKATPQAPQGAPAGAGGGLLSEVNDLGELAKREGLAQELIDVVESKLEDLHDDPTGVEQFLRANNIVLKDESGQEDFSERRMRVALRGFRDNANRVLREAPKRREWLASYSQAHAQVVKVLPWTGDPTDQRHAMMQNILTQFPGLKAAPNYEYWVACAIMGHQQLATKARPAGQPAARPAAAQPNGQPANGRPAAALPRTAGGGSGAPRVAPDKAKVDGARQKVMKDRSPQALAEYLEATGFGTR